MKNIIILLLICLSNTLYAGALKIDVTSMPAAVSVTAFAQATAIAIQSTPIIAQATVTANIYADQKGNTHIVYLLDKDGNFAEFYEGFFPVTGFMHKKKERCEITEYWAFGTADSTNGAHFQIQVPAGVTVSVMPQLITINGTADLFLYGGNVVFGSKGVSLTAITQSICPTMTPVCTIWENANTTTASAVKYAMPISTSGSDSTTPAGSKGGGETADVDDWAVIGQGIYHMKIVATDNTVKYRLKINSYLEPQEF